MPLKAVIFDMDGVLSATQKLHAQAQSKVLEKYGVEMSPGEITEKYAGREPGTLFREETDTEDPMAAHDKKQEVLYSLVEKEGVESIKGSKELVGDLHRDYRLAVASSSQPDFIQKVLEDLGIEEYFDCIESASNVDNGKPAPDVFLKVAEELGVKPRNCLVIEDGRSGMEGAKKAGMTCIGLVNEEGENPADETIEGLENLDQTSIKKIYRDS
jgi:HAD superfamily hydrolase (TIGR01509 family)